MNVWLIQANEPIPFIDEKQRSFRTGMLVDELIKQGHNVTWFASSFDHYTKNQRYEISELVKIDDTLKIQFLYGRSYVKHISMKRIKNHLEISKEFVKISKKHEVPDIIYCSFPTITLTQEVQAYGRINNVKVIVDIRDLWPEVFERAVPNKLNWLAKILFSNLNVRVLKIYKNAYALNAISQECLNYVLRKADIKKRKFDKSYFIGYPNKFRTSANFRIAQHKRNERVKISFIGTLGSQINYELIVNVAKLVEPFCDIVIGGDGPLGKTFKELAKGSKNIIFKGWINTSEIINVLNDSSFALIPYYNTFDFQMGAGNKFGEALCYALPPIVMCEGVMANLVKENKCGYYSMCAEEIAKYIVDTINTLDSYEFQVKNALDLYDKEFDSNKIYIDLVKYLEEIVEDEK